MVWIYKNTDNQPQQNSLGQVKSTLKIDFYQPHILMSQHVRFYSLERVHVLLEDSREVFLHAEELKDNIHFCWSAWFGQSNFYTDKPRSPGSLSGYKDK